MIDSQHMFKNISFLIFSSEYICQRVILFMDAASFAFELCVLILHFFSGYPYGVFIKIILIFFIFK